MYLYRMIYYSRATENHDIHAILDTARSRNERNHISGALWFDNEFFIQILEGGRSKVSETYNRIARDPRHRDIVIMQCGPIEERSFADWKMAFYQDAWNKRNQMKRYAAQDFLDPRFMKPESVVKMFSDGELA